MNQHFNTYLNTRLRMSVRDFMIRVGLLDIYFINIKTNEPTFNYLEPSLPYHQ